MDHNELAERIEKKLDDRFARLEKKLDESMEQTITNTTDLKWLKSFVKTSVGIYVALFIGTFTSLFKHFIKG